MEFSDIRSEWKRPEELIKIAEQREKENNSLSSDELLMLKSRSFYGPIALLDVAKGEEENPKRAEIRNLYNILRELDTIEDYPIPNNEEYSTIVKEKCFLMDTLNYILNEVVRINGGNDIKELVNGADLKTITKKLEERVKSGEEKIFARHFGKGPVIYELSSFGPQIKRAIHYSVERMTSGMKEFIKRGEIQEEKQLEKYCFYVAGSIGDFLKELVKQKDNFDLDEEKGQKFGEFLQLVNITKNAREDYREKRIFLPRELRPNSMSSIYLIDNEAEDAIEARKHVLERMIALAERNWDKVISYAQSIPSHLSGYKSFVIVPMIAARETIETMKRAGAEAVFAGKEEATKYQGGIEPIMTFVYKINTIDNRTKANEWLNEYQCDPEKFSFAPENYKEWSAKWTPD